MLLFKVKIFLSKRNATPIFFKLECIIRLHDYIIALIIWKKSV